MSSPLSYNGQDSPQAMAASTAGEDVDLGVVIPRRIMRVKVLYTFDNQNASTCLARLPNALNIPTVSLDETTQIGVIELKTCIQAIVAASPELVHKLGHDYTVYAYDYSEYETPLVGQGMLSWILASSSITPTAPAYQSKTMVTGRVCKNILGFFSNGTPETLEVKLKLVPVPTCLQSEYVENMEKYRSLSRIIPAGFDYNSWAEFLKANPAIGHMTRQSSEASSHHGQRRNSGNLDSIHQMLTKSVPSEDDDGYSYDRFDRAFTAQTSRASSPTPSMRSSNALQQITQDHGSRPNSRASLHSERPSQIRHNSFDADTFQDANCEGPVRKRARVTKAKRPGKSTFGTNHDSLLVTASTAASVRLHRPVPGNVSASLVNSIEPPPRAPTPRPGDKSLNGHRGRAGRAGQSMLRHATTEHDHTRYVSPYHDDGLYSDNVMDSADDEQGGSAGETPTEFPSSPPIMPHGNDALAPSSPGLPTVPCPTDSGFVSDMAIEEAEDGEGGQEYEASDLPVPTHAKQRAKQDRSHRPWTTVIPGPMELLPRRIPPRSTHNRLHRNDSAPELSINQTSNVQECITMPCAPLDAGTFDISDPERQASQSVEVQSRMIRSQEDSSKLKENVPDRIRNDRSSTPRPAPPKRPGARKLKDLPRSQTWSGVSGQELFSDAPAAETGEVSTGNVAQPRSGSGAKRTKTIKEKLQSSLAAGEMPPFCNNCGEIETPTWRKAYARVEYGVPPDTNTTADESGIVGYEVIQGGDGDDSSLQYRILKQNLANEERESGAFAVLQLCNPCGLWFNKKGTMRPPEIFNKAAVKATENPAEKPKKRRERNRANDNAARKRRREEARACAREPSSSAGFTDLNLQSDAVDASNQNAHSEATHLAPSTRPRASSLDGTVDDAERTNHPREDAATAALRRAIQSSPPGLIGTKHSPIEIEPDTTPDRTRRILFPSPRRPGEMKTLGNSPATVSGKAAPITMKSKFVPGEENTNSNVFDDGDDKENCPPPSTEHDEFAHLFEEIEMLPFQPTPSKNGPVICDLLKTQTPRSTRSTRYATTPKAFSSGHSSNATLRTPTQRARDAPVAPLTPFTAQLNALLSEGVNMSPSHFDLSNFPSLNTPGRGGIQFTDFTADDFLSSDLPLPSSPPANMFTLYEDPATATVGLWSGTSIFDASDPAAEKNERHEAVVKVEAGADLAAIIEEVVGSSGSGSSSSNDGGRAQSEQRRQSTISTLS